MQIPVGLLYDRYGLRLLLVIAIMLCAAGAFFFGNTHDLLLASLGRFFMGFGSAFAFTGVLFVAALWFKPERFAVLAGLAQFFGVFGAVSGAYPLAVLLDIFNWRIIFMALSAVGFVLALLAWCIIRDHPSQWQGPPPEKSFRSDIKRSLKLLGSDTQNWFIALYSFASWGPIMMFAALWGTPFISLRFGVDDKIGASAVSCVWIGTAVASPFIGWLSDKIKRRCLPMILLSFIGIISSMAVIYVPKMPFWSIYIFLFFMGTASSAQILGFALIKDRNKHSVLAAGIGFNNMAVVLGGAILQPAVGFILSSLWGGDYVNGIPVYTTYDYGIALLLVPLCFLTAFTVSSLFLEETRCQLKYPKNPRS